jgi:hypothetical protein
VELDCPKLTSLELDFSPAMQHNGPLDGLVQSLSSCAKSLNWCVNYPFTDASEVSKKQKNVATSKQRPLIER